MNRMRKIYSAVAGSIMALVLTSCSSGEDWQYVATSSTGSATSYQQWETYYDKNSIEPNAGGMIKVWIKHVPRTNREEVIEIHEYEQRQLDMIKGMHSFIEKTDLVKPIGAKFDHTRMLVEIDCEQQAARTLYIGDYDLTGTLLSSDTTVDQPFSRIAKESNAERLLRIVCG